MAEKRKKSFMDRMLCYDETCEFIKKHNLKYNFESEKYKYTPQRMPTHPPFQNTFVKIYNMDIIDMGLILTEKGYNPLLLNNADRFFPCGNVEQCVVSQEESLFRRTNYFQALTMEYYPIKPDECVYSPNVLCIRKSENDHWEFYDQFKYINFVACPGIYQPKLEHDHKDGTNVYKHFNKKDEEIFLNKIRLIFQTGYKHGHNALVLGALSCDAWHGPTRHIAKLFKQVCNEYNGLFGVVAFAMLDNDVTKQKKESNFNVFCEVFEQKND